jgi:RNA polymerase sigma factor (sigma-70 family)
MPNFDPRFWEIVLDNNELDKFPYESLFCYQSPEERQRQLQRELERKQILNIVLDIIELELTPIQRDCIKLYFLEGKTQAEVSEILGISRRVVSQHIYGIRRNGKRVGGAIKKIRKICRKQGIRIVKE